MQFQNRSKINLCCCAELALCGVFKIEQSSKQKKENWYGYEGMHEQTNKAKIIFITSSYYTFAAIAQITLLSYKTAENFPSNKFQRPSIIINTLNAFGWTLAHAPSKANHHTSDSADSKGEKSPQSIIVDQYMLSCLVRFIFTSHIEEVSALHHNI